MNDEERKVIASAIGTLLLSDHMGDAHEAGVELAKLLWGKAGAEDYEARCDDCDSEGGQRMRKRLAKYVPEVWSE